MLWLDVTAAVVEALGATETPGAVKAEVTPLEVLMELCWMASFWGLLGTDMSSTLMSLSETLEVTKE